MKCIWRKIPMIQNNFLKKEAAFRCNEDMNNKEKNVGEDIKIIYTINERR